MILIQAGCPNIILENFFNEYLTSSITLSIVVNIWLFEVTPNIKTMKSLGIDQVKKWLIQQKLGISFRISDSNTSFTSIHDRIGLNLFKSLLAELLQR